MKRLLIYDASEKSFVGRLWQMGATLFSWKFDKVLAVKSWKDCLQQLQGLRGKEFDEIQVWSHGSPGETYICNTPETDVFYGFCEKILVPHGHLWLRNCGFARGKRGKAAMQSVANYINRDVYAFTHNIGDWASQSGLVGLRPLEVPYWSELDGYDTKGMPLDSRPWYKNTIPALTMELPDWAKKRS